VLFFFTNSCVGCDDPGVVLGELVVAAPQQVVQQVRPTLVLSNTCDLPYASKVGYATA